MPDQEDGLLGSRQAKLNRLRQRGIDPYPPRFKTTSDAATATANFEAGGKERSSVSGRRPGIGRAHHVPSGNGSGRLPGFKGRVRRHPGPPPPERTGRGLRIAKGPGPGRFLGCYRSHHADPHRTGNHRGSPVDAFGQGDAPFARKMARPAGRGDPLPAKVSRFDRQSGGDGHLRAERADHQEHPEFPGPTGLPGGGYAHPGPGGRRRPRSALRDPPQRPGPAALPAHRHRAIPETA